MLKRRTTRIFTYGISRERLERAIEHLRAPVEVVDEPGRADLFLTLKSQEKGKGRSRRVVVYP